MALSRRHVLISAPAFILAGCGVLTRSYVINFKFTLYLLLNGIERTASTVIRARWVDTLGLNDSGERWSGSIKGDAICMDLGGRRALLGLLGTLQGQQNGLSLSLGSLFSYTPNGHYTSDDVRLFDELKQLKGEHDLPKRNWPILMYFSDLKDLKTGKFLSLEDNPLVPDIDLEATRFTFAVTDEQYSSGLAERLRWFDQLGTFKANLLQPPQTLPAFEQIQPQNIRAVGVAGIT